MGQRGFCAASWQPEVVALATPIRMSGSIYALNVSVSTDESLRSVVESLGGALMALRLAIETALAHQSAP